MLGGGGGDFYLLGKVAGLVGEDLVCMCMYIYLPILTEYNEQNEKVFGLVYVYVYVCMDRLS